MVLGTLVVIGLVIFLATVALRDSGARKSDRLEGYSQTQLDTGFRVDTHRRVNPSKVLPRPTLASAARVSSRPVDDMTFDVVYRDGDDEITARRIEIEAVSRNFDSIYVDAWCHLRRAQRTFRLDRILEVSSALTGEIFDPPVDALMRHLKEKSDPGSGFKSVIGRARRGLLSLIWLARTDHDVSEAETEIMLAYIRDRIALGAPLRGDGEWKEWAARQWIDAQRPTLEDALGAKTIMGHKGEEQKLCARYARQILDAQPEHLRQKVANRVARLGFTHPEEP